MPVFKFNIKNIKGFDENDHNFQLVLCPRKINYVVAPNGCGKTSFTTAFACLKNKLEVPTELKYRKLKKGHPPYVSLQIDNGPVLIADGRANRISSEIIPVVINSRVYATDITQQVNNRVYTDPVEKVLDIIAYEHIPSERVLPYNYETMKRLMPRKGKALSNLRQDLNSPLFKKSLFLALPEIQHLNTHSNVNDRVNGIISTLEHINCQYRTLGRHVNNTMFDSIRNLKHYIGFKNSFREYLFQNGNQLTELDFFLLFVQINNIFNLHNNELKEICRRYEYEKFKKDLDNELNCIKCPWKSAVTMVENNNLLVHFPLVNELSNGQRDIATFFVQLLLFKINRQENKDYILIIDEIFDYLDEGADENFRGKLRGGTNQRWCIHDTRRMVCLQYHEAEL